jgi:hypothetical protein
MNSKREYDSTVARIAGNILSGVLNNVTLASAAKDGVRSELNYIVLGAVEVARLVVAETKRTEPKSESPS